MVRGVDPDRAVDILHAERRIRSHLVFLLEDFFERFDGEGGRTKKQKESGRDEKRRCRRMTNDE